MAKEEQSAAAGVSSFDFVSSAAGGVGDIAQHTAANHAVILEINAIVPFMGVAGKDGSHRRIGSLGFLVEGITVKDVDIIAAVNRIIVGSKGAALDGQLRAARGCHSAAVSGLVAGKGAVVQGDVGIAAINSAAAAGVAAIDGVVLKGAVVGRNHRCSPAVRLRINRSTAVACAGISGCAVPEGHIVQRQLYAGFHIHGPAQLAVEECAVDGQILDLDAGGCGHIKAEGCVHLLGGCHIAVLVRDIFRNLAILVSRDGLAVAVDGDRLIDCGGGGGNGVHLTGIGDVGGQLDGIAVLGLAQSRRQLFPAGNLIGLFSGRDRVLQSVGDGVDDTPGTVCSTGDGIHVCALLLNHLGDDAFCTVEIGRSITVRIDSDRSDLSTGDGDGHLSGAAVTSGGAGIGTVFQCA